MTNCSNTNDTNHSNESKWWNKTRRIKNKSKQKANANYLVQKKKRKNSNAKIASDKILPTSLSTRLHSLSLRHKLTRILAPLFMITLGLTKSPLAAFAMGGAVGGSKPVLPMKR